MELVRRLSDEGAVRPFPPNEGGRMAQHVRKGEGRKEGKDGVDLISSILTECSIHPHKLLHNHDYSHKCFPLCGLG